MRARDDSSPVIVNNPYKDVLMNVEPFFRLMQWYSLDEALTWADTGIKFISLSETPVWMDNEERQSMIMFLYEIRDLFSFMAQCQISTPKKGGAS
ncbi:MAG: hypothetical protein A2W86_11845 [Bacteroidetes bacterium GWD2_45_23]|nr:MAG: hypothetical protein A2W87_08170 [Bacteroidetes bacterium GWC2_46_850]OFX85513.1 MAG: hypothetical protein A2W86_11845 [Bacteroidetes bacterium GWD2_45_23]HBB00739.1 hypothetical protein [Porphyromonadaceae bacterium]HCC19364.1 hypothetical protein [Porphyromonadaceae bacterium]